MHDGRSHRPTATRPPASPARPATPGASCTGCWRAIRGCAAAACTADTRALAECDLAFLALPHGASGELGRELAGARVPVVDLSADLRAEWQYGLPELHRDRDRRVGGGREPGLLRHRRAARPGTAGRGGAIEPHVVVDGKSGVSGAGKKPTDANAFCPPPRASRPTRRSATTTSSRSSTQLSALAGAPQTVTFTPHLAPFTRGLLVTAYGRLAAPITQAELRRPVPRPLRRRAVRQLGRRRRGRSRCAAPTSARSRRGSIPSAGAVIVAAAIDNLVKGAAGQAIQNANLMLGFDEALGLPAEASWL